MAKIKNEFLEVELNPKGAEIISIIGQSDNLNYMWKRDACQWANSAPILFPIVGGVRNEEYKYNGQSYHLTNHGFSRHQEYKETVDGNKVTYTLTSNDEIYKVYPFLFELNVTYTLVENKLVCDINCKNVDEKTIYFQVGGHPAFAVPLFENESSNDYYIEFSENETKARKVIDVARKGMSRVEEPFFENERRFFVRQDLFSRDAIVLKNFKSENISLKSLNHNKSVVFHMSNFDHVGLWAAKHVGGLIAIEPWVGHADYVDFEGEISEKESCVALEVGQEFACQFVVEINQ